ncbi:hypothetical protein POM88_047797 [Heracleum sosnowskyi]|uniref:Transcriptional factor DELLA N-terminal domain-containing protein n=1 Tax=Heracleum sosnowskyi TaxID=360622 RepID=A0AAD8LZ24_9APIA|nr:hypothetical protein POM88_047797 [Heracleum sosnowskyi]
MKRDHPHPHPQPNQPSFSDCEQDVGVDELLTVVGYKVKSSDMAMGQAQQQGISQLGSDTVHYNPSDLSSWLESMIAELNPQPHHLASGSNIIFDDSDYDLKAVPGKAVFPNQNQIIQPVKELTESKDTSR